MGDPGGVQVQSPAAEPHTARLGGRVLDALTGRPLPRSRVELTGERRLTVLAGETQSVRLIAGADR